MRRNKDYNWQGFFFSLPLNLHFWIIVIYSRDGESVFIQSRTEILLILALGRMGTVIFLLVFIKLIDVGLMFEAAMVWHLGLKY